MAENAERRAARRALLEKVETLLDPEGSNEAGDEARALAEIDASLKLGRMTDMLAKEPRAEKLLAALDEDDYEAEPLNEAAMGGRKGASTAGDDTSDVFALQVFVESLEMTPMPANHNDVDGQNETAHANRMAVAFRLLDFPTVLIERAGSSPENFQSGKSCLFELPFEEAIAGLQSAPMYLMLLRLPEAGDKNAQVSKGVSTAASPDLHHGVLVGSTALDLSGLVGLHNVGSEGCVLPSMASTWGWKLGTFPLYDLMGNEVARVAARVRVCSFGDGLLPHLGLASAPADQQPSPVNEMETAMDVRMGQTGLPAPVPTALLETMSAVEKRLCKIERLQRRAMHRKRMLAQDQTKRASQSSPMAGKSSSGWLPRPGEDEASCLPPAMYFCNSVGGRGEQEDESDGASDSDFASLDGSEDELAHTTMAWGDDSAPHDLLRALATHLKLLPSQLDNPAQHQLNQKQGRHSRGRPSTKIARNKGRRTHKSRERSSDEKSVGAEDHKRSARGDSVAPAPVIREGMPPTHGHKRRILRVRKTRTQILREQATRRRFQASGVSTENDAVGVVQLTADLARSRALNERAPEERRYLLERRKAHAARQSHDSSNLRLESLVQSALVQDTGQDMAEREARARQEQLELMLRGELSPRPAFQLDRSYLSAVTVDDPRQPPSVLHDSQEHEVPPPPPSPPLPPPPLSETVVPPTPTPLTPKSAKERDQHMYAPLTPILSSPAVLAPQRARGEMRSTATGARESTTSNHPLRPRQRESRESSEFGDAGTPSHNSRASVHRRERAKPRGPLRRAKPRTPSLVSIDHFVMDPVPPPEHDLASSRYQSFDGGNASLASAVF